MSIYDTILANTQQGYQNLANQQMQMAQQPTFADKFLAGLKEREQIDYQRKMAESNLAMNQTYKQAQEENMRRQRVQDIYSGLSKMTLDPAARQAMVDRLVSSGESSDVAEQLVPRAGEGGLARGYEAQKAFEENERKKEHEKNLSVLNSTRADLYKAQMEHAQADTAEKKALLAAKVKFLTDRANTFEALVNSQIWRNYNAPALAIYNAQQGVLNAQEQGKTQHALSSIDAMRSTIGRVLSNSEINNGAYIIGAGWKRVPGPQVDQLHNDLATLGTEKALNFVENLKAQGVGMRWNLTEWNELHNAIANLKPNQEPGVLKRNLAILDKYFEKMAEEVKTTGANVSAARGFGASEQPQQGGKVGTEAMLSGWLRDNPDRSRADGISLMKQHGYNVEGL